MPKLSPQCALIVVRENNMDVKTYSELIKLPTFEERYEYLRFQGVVGEDTFGFERYLNQRFYQSAEWKRIRRHIIARDLGCDLGVKGYEIYEPIIIHHLNPLTKHDILGRTEYLTNPEFLICTTQRTHNAIHYGDNNLLAKAPTERKQNDTCPWRK